MLTNILSSDRARAISIKLDMKLHISYVAAGLADTYKLHNGTYTIVLTQCYCIPMYLCIKVYQGKSNAVSTSRVYASTRLKHTSTSSRLASYIKRMLD